MDNEEYKVIGHISYESFCGVVGYHIRLTRERSSDRTRADAFFIPYDIRYKCENIFKINNVYVIL
jgi:hypothetical protein